MNIALHVRGHLLAIEHQAPANHIGLPRGMSLLDSPADLNRQLQRGCGV